ncbi:DUF5672 family protein [Parabacteroides sp. APC149_11_2_Y6]
MDTVVIIIPIYRVALNEFEQIALQQCISVLGHYPIVFIAPKSLHTKELEQTYGIHTVIRFKDDYFRGLDGYNHLMLSSEFYERFLQYRYLLIYQTDAYVFSDKLREWCDKGYDYIGAPWIPSAKYNRILNRKELAISQFFSRLFSVHNARSNYFQTGNGGFSLRNTNICYQVTLSNQKDISQFLKQTSSHYGEDVYWGIHANRKKRQLYVPDYKEALSFAFENHPQLLYQKNHEQLPFGAHAWYKGDRLNFWRPFIPQLAKIEKL